MAEGEGVDLALQILRSKPFTVNCVLMLCTACQSRDHAMLISTRSMMVVAGVRLEDDFS